ncbi:flavodoxin family protein [Streptacidiphilus neutrinimicus]|uniref:flavodoxin family protein n=1 Tax=Streptacidiphilus neutrinimicus TaxID=105420 RepID=UPI0005A96DE4|nr:flavodoxin family protein [Streptacidiphilus neutrinimicus]
MKALIVCTSVSHGNTRRIADAMGRALRARVVDPGQVDPEELSGFDLVGFGSGIYLRRFHPRLRRFVRALPADGHGRAFVFATSGLPGVPFRPLERALGQKGFRVDGAFSCRAFDTFLPFRLVGGLHKGLPGPADLDAAHAFAERLARRSTKA